LDFALPKPGFRDLTDPAKLISSARSPVESPTMRSQKISNRSPRPFKNQSSTKGWGGGDCGFIPGGKQQPPLKKLKPKASETDAASSGESAAVESEES
jgi:hypothetical protein